MYPADAVSGYKSVEIPWTTLVRTNIVFDGDKQLASYKEVRHELKLDDMYPVYRIPFADKYVYVCPFDTFCAMFGEYR